MAKKLKVDTIRTKRNHGTAYWMARIAQSVYQKADRGGDPNFPDERGILNDLKGEDDGFIGVKGFSRNSAQAAVVEHRDYICFAFRGTDQLADWLDNIQVSRVRALFGEFHRGFWESNEDVFHDMRLHYNALRQRTIDEARKAASRKTKGSKAKSGKAPLIVNQRPLFFAGHSLGGAMATIASAHFAAEDAAYHATYTFGQPRAMTLETARDFNEWSGKRFYRFHNNNDLVPRVPGRLLGYSHVGQLVYITYDGELYDDTGFWMRFLDAIDGAVSAAKEKGIDGIEDHGMDRYVAAIEAWNEKF
jgi:hypothetical protein